MDIVMVLNIPEREIDIMERIKKEILRSEPASRVAIIEARDPDFLTKILDFRPSVVLTYPFSAYPISRRYYILKYLLGCHIVCLRTEGILYFESDHVKVMVGLDKYSRELVDYEIVWGKEAARHLASELLNQNKLSTSDRVKSLGYVLYEDHFRQPTDQALPGETMARILHHRKEHILLMATGFTLADYSREDIIRAGDQFDVNNPASYDVELQKRLQRTQSARRHRIAWIETIAATAARFPEILIIVKTHPTENFIFERRHYNPYTVLSEHSNIVLITEPVPIIDLMRRCGLFLHYGSTTAAESYLLNVPSILIDDDDLVTMPKGWTSTRKISIHQLPDLVAEHLLAPIRYKASEEMLRALDNAFNINEQHLARTVPYQPSRDIADFLSGLENEPAQAIRRDDEYFKTALQHHGKEALEFLQRQKMMEQPAGHGQQNSSAYHHAVS